jgi:hypothetical protein
VLAKSACVVAGSLPTTGLLCTTTVAQARALAVLSLEALLEEGGGVADLFVVAEGGYLLAA